MRIIDFLSLSLSLSHSLVSELREQVHWRARMDTHPATLRTSVAGKNILPDSVT